MTNKRQLKKFINQASADFVEALFVTDMVSPIDDEKKVFELLNDIQTLRDNCLAKASVSFDKTASAFESRQDYHKAHRVYYRQAYGELYKEFVTGLDKQVAELNKLLNNK